MRKHFPSFEHRSLCCADFGVPTIRTRLFGVARADGGAVSWPVPTHAPRGKAKALKLKPWVGAHTIIDWSLPVKSIFDRKKPLAEATLRRIARGVMRFVVEAADPFIVPICQTSSTTPGRSVREPLSTLTTAKGGELAVIAPYVTPVTHAGGPDPAYSFEEPLHTFTSANRGELALIAPVLAGAGGRAAQTDPRDMREPLNTTSTKEDRILSAVHLTQFRTGATGTDLRDPLPTYTANSFHKRPGGAPPMGIAAVHLEKFSENSAGLDPRDPLNTVMAGGQGHAVIAATMVQTGYGEREGQAPRVKDIGEPAGTQMAGGSKEALVAAFLAKHNTDVVGNDAREPLSTVTTGGDRGQTQIAPVMASLRGSAKGGRDLQQPLPAQMSGGNHELLILPFLQAYYGTGVAHDARDPLHTVTVGDRHGLVTVEVNGQTMVITDICMRMLDPLEGARAHGFDPASLQHEIEVTDANGRKLRRKPNKTEIGHLVGNSVPPRMVELLARANCRHELTVAA